MDLDGYAARYPNASLERRDGILEVTLHDGHGGPLKWSGSAHALALLSDIVIAADDAVIRDFHYEYGIVPGDGVHVVWTMLLGMNRGRYYLLTGEQIPAAEALEGLASGYGNWR